MHACILDTALELPYTGTATRMLAHRTQTVTHPAVKSSMEDLQAAFLATRAGSRTDSDGGAEGGEGRGSGLRCCSSFFEFMSTPRYHAVIDVFSALQTQTSLPPVELLSRHELRHASDVGPLLLKVAGKETGRFILLVRILMALQLSMSGIKECEGIAAQLLRLGS